MSESREARTRFGDLLRSYRRAAGLTQETLAERAGFSTVYISMLERGERRPQRSTVEHLSAALSLTDFDRTALLTAAEEETHDGIVGRRAELELIERHLAGQTPRLLLVAGEPGIGKTSVLREARRLALTRGWRVLEGGCSRRGGQEPYAPLLDALQAYCRDQSTDRLGTELAGCAWLTRLLPELEALAKPPPALAADQEERLILLALNRFLGQIGGPSGTLLLLDDLQWAGSDALDALASLLAGESPVRVIAAYRDVDVPRTGPLAILIGDLAQAGRVIHHALSPLDETEADALLRLLLAGEPTIEASLRTRALDQTGGVPFFLVSFAEELRSGLATGRQPGSMPWSVTQGIRRRVASLSPPAADILAVAAVAGRSISESLLETLTGLEGEVLVEALDSICLAGLLTEDETQQYRFKHDMVREVIEADLGPARRRDLHRRLAAALEPAQPVEALAYHYVRAGDEAKAAAYLELAGDRARDRHAHGSAAGFYRELVDRLEAADKLLEAAQTREKLGAVLMAGGQYEEALTVLGKAATWYRHELLREREWTVTARIARVHERRGRPTEGIDELLRLRVLAHGGLDRAEAEVDIVLASLFLVSGRYAEQLEAATRAAETARALGDDRLRAEAEVWYGCALNQLGRIDEGLELLRTTVPLADQVGDLASLSHALNDLGFLTEIGGDFVVSRHYKGRALQLAKQMDDPLAIATMTFRCGQNAFLRGDWTAAEALFRHGIDTARSLGSSSISAYPPFGLALLDFARQDIPAARNHLDESMRSAAHGDRQARRAALILLAECELHDGDPLAALHHLEQAGPDGDGLGLYPAGPVMAATLLALGRQAEAGAAATEALALATSRRHRVAEVDALRVQGMTCPSGDEGIHAFEQARVLARSMGYVFGELRVLESAGQAQSDSDVVERIWALRVQLNQGGAPIPA